MWKLPEDKSHIVFLVISPAAVLYLERVGGLFLFLPVYLQSFVIVAFTLNWCLINCNLK